MEYLVVASPNLPPYGAIATDINEFLEGMGKFETPMSDKSADETVAFFTRNFPGLAKHLRKIPAE